MRRKLKKTHTQKRNRSLTTLWHRLWRSGANPLSQKRRLSRARSEFFLSLGRLKLAGVFILMGICAGVWASGYPQSLYAQVGQWALGHSARLGLQLVHIQISGAQNVRPNDILKLLKLRRHTPLLSYNLRTMKRTLESLSWIEQASIQRSFPNRLVIQLRERQPVMIWQNKKKHFLINEQGVVLSDRIPVKYKGLPIVIGDTAPENLLPIRTLLDAYPNIKNRVSALIFVANRRWNLKLKDGLIVRLPEDNLPQALSKLERILQNSKIDFSRFTTIDLRTAHKTIMQPKVGGRPQRTRLKERAI